MKLVGHDSEAADTHAAADMVCSEAHNSDNPLSRGGPRYAGFFWRLAGFLIDFPLVLLSSAVLAIVVGWVSVHAWSRALPTQVGVWLTVATAWCYHAGFECSPWKGTPGKRMFGLRVVTSHGRRLGFPAAGLRAALRIVSWVLCLSGFVLALFGRKHQALHDQLAGTVVVHGRGHGGVLGLIPQPVRRALGAYPNANMALVSIGMLAATGCAVNWLMEPLLLQDNATKAVRASLEQAKPLQDYVAMERRNGSYPAALPAALTAALRLPGGVTTRYFPSSGVIDLAFAANPYLQDRVIVLLPVASGGTVRWVCSGNGIVAEVLPRSCR